MGGPNFKDVLAGWPVGGPNFKAFFSTINFSLVVPG